jgi:hypothetical protein
MEGNRMPVSHLPTRSEETPIRSLSAAWEMPSALRRRIREGIMKPNWLAFTLARSLAAVGEHVFGNFFGRLFARGPCLVLPSVKSRIRNPCINAGVAQRPSGLFGDFYQLFPII